MIDILDRVATLLPEPFEWDYIPVGKVILENGFYVSSEKNTFEVGDFYIAKYPVTNHQFKVFIDDKGYQTKSYWTDNGWKYCKEENWQQPAYFNNPKWNGYLQPVIGVSFYEAVAFINWLNARCLKDDAVFINLPTETQWQRAAQGDDGRRFTWGNVWDNEKANTSSIIGKTTPVSKYPNGASPYGVFDMNGNVMEYCMTEVYSGKSHQDIDSCMLRGGDWYHGKEFRDITFRGMSGAVDIHDGYQYIGFRICAVAIENNS